MKNMLFSWHKDVRSHDDGRFFVDFISVCSKTSEHCIQLTKRIYSSFSRKIPSHGIKLHFRVGYRCIEMVCYQDEAYLIRLSFAFRLTPEELEYLWEKRNFLYNHPDALGKVLLAIPRWDFLSLQEIYTMIQDWSPLNPIQAMELLLPW